MYAVERQCCRGAAKKGTTTANRGFNSISKWFQTNSFGQIVQVVQMEVYNILDWKYYCAQRCSWPWATIFQFCACEGGSFGDYYYYIIKVLIGLRSPTCCILRLGFQ